MVSPPSQIFTTHFRTSILYFNFTDCLKTHLSTALVHYAFWSKKKNHPCIIFAFYYSTHHLTFEDRLTELISEGSLLCAGIQVPKSSVYIHFTVVLNTSNVSTTLESTDCLGQNSARNSASELDFSF